MRGPAVGAGPAEPVAPAAPGTSHLVPAVVVALFTVSGATALVYEVLWTRALGLIFGHTVFAVTTVLAAFMLGLCLGSALLGRLARRAGNPLRLYAALEAGIGLGALAVPHLIEAVAPLALPVAAAGATPIVLSAVQFGLVLPILLVPTALMGGTLPVLVRLTGDGIQGLGVRSATLYAANTFGAVGGVASAGFLLLPAFGNRGTGRLAVGANLAGAAAAWILSRAAARGPGSAGPAPAPAGAPLIPLSAAAAGRRRAALGALAISGAIAMACETAWVRALTLVIGSSTYAFTAMLVAFLLGIALGSAAYAARAPRPTLGLLAGLQWGAAAAGVLALLAFRRMPHLFLWGFAAWEMPTPAAVQALQVGLCILILLPTTCAFGAAFPCAVALAARPEDHAARAVATPYAVNTLGAIAGTVAAGFGTIPRLGAEGTLRAAIAAGAIVALALVACHARVGAAGPAGAAALALAAVALPAWDRQLLASGVAIYGNTYLATPGGLAAALAAERLLYYRDGIGATVSVHENARGRFLRINGKTDASTGDMETQLMLGHLPLLLHPGGQDVLVIGLGSGVTAGAVLRHPVRSLEVIEIEPAVVEGAAFFRRENRDALRDPRARLRLADARQFLLASRARYDVIISEPSNPWIGGMAALFTEEFFRLARSRLRPGGIMVQWVHGYGLAPEDLRMVAATFRTAFPAATLWGPTGADYLLVGAPAPLVVDLEAIGARLAAAPGVGEDLAALGFSSPGTLLADFLLTEADLARYAAGAPRNRDDGLPLEFSAPRSLYRDTTAENRERVMAARRAQVPPLAGPGLDLNAPPFRHALAAPLLRRGQAREALAHLDRALARDPTYLAARVDRGKALLLLGRLAEAQAELEGVLQRHPDFPEAVFALGAVRAARGDATGAAREYARAVALAPARGRYRAALAGAYLAAGEFARAEVAYRAALALAPGDPALREGLALAVRGRAGRPAP